MKFNEIKKSIDISYVLDEWRAEVGSILIMDKLDIDFNLDLNAYSLNDTTAELITNIPLPYLTADEHWEKIDQVINSAYFYWKK